MRIDRLLDLGASFSNPQFATCVLYDASQRLAFGWWRYARVLARNVAVDTVSPSEDSSRQKPMKLFGTQALVTLSGLVVVAVVLASAVRQEGFC